MSHKLQVGEMQASYLTDKEIWGHFNYIFSAKSKNSTTYKFVLLKSMIENLYNVNEELKLEYSALFGSFAKIYWNLVIHHDLNQINMVGKKAEVQNVLLDVQAKHQIPSTLVFDRLSFDLQLKIILRVLKKCKINVMGAIYGDTKGTIYDFDNKKEYLKINKSFYLFMQRYQRVLTYLANYHLALFLERFNEQGNTTGMLLKVENVSKRSSLDPFYQVLASFYDSSCFYCGKKIKGREAAHVDHFIPWSFVQSDQLWNLVIACGPCNLSKSDKLPKDAFLDKLMDRNRQILVIADIKNRDDMKVYTQNKVIELYKYSYENGFTDIWVPRSMVK